MDDAGFVKAESILNEWNYVKGWTDDFQYSLEVESGMFAQKGAAFIAGTMVDCQAKPVDMLMFYDARLNTGMNNMFSRPTYQPMKGYYPFYAWSKLVDRGTQVACTVKEGRGEFSDANTGTVFKSENYSGELMMPAIVRELPCSCGEGLRRFGRDFRRSLLRGQQRHRHGRGEGRGAGRLAREGTLPPD